MSFPRRSSVSFKALPGGEPARSPPVPAPVVGGLRSSAEKVCTGARMLRRAGTTKLTMKKNDRKNIDWKPLIDNGAFEDKNKILDHMTVRKQDDHRKKLLGMARNLSPIDTVGRIALIPRTVIPRILRHPLAWLVLLSFASSATISRCGVDFGEVDLNAFDGSNTVMTFMVIFYVGYCYTRYTSQLEDVQMIMHSIVNLCKLARTCFEDQQEVHRIWRYLNQLHAAAYTGLTASYSDENFFKPICDKYGLRATDPRARAEETKLLKDVQLDGEDARFCSILQVWVMEIIKDEMNRSQRPSMSPAIGRQLLVEMEEVGNGVKHLFAYQYQVLPFIYTHLVSASCVLYLAFNAFIYGLYFAPESGYLFGLVLPLCSVLLNMLAVFGLLEVGDTILDPFGQDPEDFAVLHFVECTAVASLEAIQVEEPPRRQYELDKTKVSFYTNDEMLAATRLVGQIVRNYRRRKQREQEEAERQAEYKRKLDGLLAARCGPRSANHVLTGDARAQSPPAAQCCTAPCASSSMHACSTLKTQGAEAGSASVVAHELDGLTCNPARGITSNVAVEVRAHRRRAAHRTGSRREHPGRTVDRAASQKAMNAWAKGQIERFDSEPAYAERMMERFGSRASFDEYLRSRVALRTSTPLAEEQRQWMSQIGSRSVTRSPTPLVVSPPPSRRGEHHAICEANSAAAQLSA